LAKSSKNYSVEGLAYCKNQNNADKSESERDARADVKAPLAGDEANNWLLMAASP
jgi:hypothetical protein